MIAGVDYSTRAVDVVLLDEDSDAATWHRFELHGEDAFTRTRDIRQSFRPSSGILFEDCLAIGIEEPAGQMTGRMFRVQGAILMCLPPRTLVKTLMPSEWRKTVGLPGNCSKEDVEFHVRFNLWGPGADHSGKSYPPDYFDAYCIALATRTLLQHGEKAA